MSSEIFNMCIHLQSRREAAAGDAAAEGRSVALHVHSEAAAGSAELRAEQGSRHTSTHSVRQPRAESQPRFQYHRHRLSGGRELCSCLQVSWSF